MGHGRSELSPSFRSRIETLRREVVGNVYEGTVDRQSGKKGDPVVRGVGSYQTLCVIIEYYREKPLAEERVRFRIDEINPSTTPDGKANVVAFGSLVYQ